jgi:hypothetical protein
VIGDPALIQITPAGVTHPGHAILRALRNEFEKQDWVRLPRLLSPDLLAVIRRQIDASEFRERVHESIGSNSELCLTETATSILLHLHLLLNRQAWFQLIREITGCPPIACFVGRVYRITPGLGHHDAWHDDMREDRLLALSLNLSAEVYSGGILQMRDSQTSRILHEVINIGFGDAIALRLARHLQHRITPIEGTAAKTAFAGWFQSEPDFPSLLKPSTPDRPRRTRPKIG